MAKGAGLMEVTSMKKIHSSINHSSIAPFKNFRLCIGLLPVLLLASCDQQKEEVEDRKEVKLDIIEDQKDAVEERAEAAQARYDAEKEKVEAQAEVAKAEIDTQRAEAEAAAAKAEIDAARAKDESAATRSNEARANAGTAIRSNDERANAGNAGDFAADVEKAGTDAGTLPRTSNDSSDLDQ